MNNPVILVIVSETPWWNKMEHKIYMNSEWKHVEQLCDIENDVNWHCYRLYLTIDNTLLEERKQNNPDYVLFRIERLAKFSCVLRPG